MGMDGSLNMIAYRRADCVASFDSALAHLFEHERLGESAINEDNLLEVAASLAALRPRG
jgi:hypothetical protein